ncbi:DUF305 domain-containing protein [Diplocloster modestus]|uniref:DUF305 domain-containing protein n=1 Tax=Diplocloster modestus TaxID=2850322 RepID=A0ABS6K3F6_9FIRM|nr:DUF305 domain-containing protein [Diplocloster modestus]MBU9725041.1 DUF305 domain-containing protein [Diplocloster modestus]
MNCSYRLSNVTQDYLAEFEYILDEMIRGMTEAPFTCSISYNFIVQMIPHHMAAIEMSHNILKYTTNIQVQDIASNIITSQTKSINNMRNIQYACGEITNSEQDLYQYQCQFGRITQAMFTDMRNACTTNRINCNFMREMIPHHRGAVEMSENALQYPICCGLNPILYSIITSQRRGIMQMQQLLRCLGC